MILARPRLSLIQRTVLEAPPWARPAAQSPADAAATDSPHRRQSWLSAWRIRNIVHLCAKADGGVIDGTRWLCPTGAVVVACHAAMGSEAIGARSGARRDVELLAVPSADRPTAGWTAARRARARGYSLAERPPAPRPRICTPVTVTDGIPDAVERLTPGALPRRSAVPGSPDRADGRPGGPCPLRSATARRRSAVPEALV